MKNKFFFFIAILFLVGGCGDSFRKERQVLRPVPYTITATSALFNKNMVEFKLDSMKHTLFISMHIKNPKYIPFPRSKKYGDTLFRTAFRFDFYSGNQLIQSEFTALRNSLKWQTDSSLNVSNLCITTDTSDLRNNPDFEIRLPYLAFHSLKKGKHTIELRVHQDVFTEELRVENPDGTHDYVRAYEHASLLNASFKFDINIPPVYKSTIYGYGLELKNDSTFSPAGMDNTIWKSSYPDIYWTVYYPENVAYCQTEYQTSTDKYRGKDAFTLYHYSADDSLGIGVYDHDNLSRDDGLGYWWGSMKFLQREPLRRISFGNVKSFDVKIKEEGVVN
jgi:hypothetical protein